MTIISGSIAIHTNTSAVERLELISHKYCNVETGNHLENRLNGGWTTWSNAYSHDILIPARSKELKLLTTNESTVYNLANCLLELDTTATGARHLHKLYLLMLEVALLEDSEFTYAASVNNIGLKGTFSLLSNNVPIYLYLIVDSITKSVQLFWSTLNLKSEIRNTYGLRYFFYQFPVILDRPLFIHTQTLTAHWWRWNKFFGGSDDCMLKCINALELYLFKDPQLENL